MDQQKVLNSILTENQGGQSQLFMLGMLRTQDENLESVKLFLSEKVIQTEGCELNKFHSTDQATLKFTSHLTHRAFNICD